MTLNDGIAALLRVRDVMPHRLSPDERGNLPLRIRLKDRFVNTDALSYSVAIEAEAEQLFSVYINSGLPPR